MNVALDSYKNSIKQKIESNKVYPARAIRRGYEGDVTVEFTVLKNGSIKSLELVSPAPSENINIAAISAVKNSIPFEAFPTNIRKENIKVVIPFSFRTQNIRHR